MKVRVTTACAGHGFSFAHNQEVDSEEFEAKVGFGWRSICEPVAITDDTAAEDLQRQSQPRRRGRR